MKLVTILAILATIHGYAQQFPHASAHAHNDYVHSRPLFDALQHGFTSVEADIHLVNGKLLVSHDNPNKDAPTLEALYLHPLDSIIQKNKGRVYPSYSHPVVLMIDVKTDGEQSFSQLLLLLSSYRGDLNTPGHAGPLQVIISGNRAIELIKGDPKHLASIDGRPEDVGKGYTTDQMPVISEAYHKVSGESIDNAPSEMALQRIKDLASKVHAEHKKLRLWAIPDNEASWSALIKAGVDIINTDKLAAFHAYLANIKK